VGHGRRQILWFGVTAHPTSEWIANQITEACGWEQAPQYLIRDQTEEIQRPAPAVRNSSYAAAGGLRRWFRWYRRTRTLLLPVKQRR
jgi:hypothetical protein